MAYVIYLGITDLPPSLLSLPKPERQQQERWTLIKPEFAENEWRKGEVRSVEERSTYPGSCQKLGRGLQEWQLLQITVGAQLRWEPRSEKQLIFHCHTPISVIQLPPLCLLLLPHTESGAWTRI